MSDGFKWITHTEPFESLDGSPARFVLEQVDDAAFRLRRGFRYRHRDGSTLEVSDTTLGLTDLASSPRCWRGSSAGRGGTRPLPWYTTSSSPAGCHCPSGSRPTARSSRPWTLLGVPPVRSHIMWTGVTLATRWRGGLRSKTGIVLWLAGSAAGTALLIHGLVTGSPGEVAIALLLPLPAGALWGKQIWAGVVAGYSIWFVVIPALASFFGYSSYRIAEEVVRYGRKAFSRRGEKVPTPVPYREA